MAANESTERPLEGLTGRPIGYDDATWILTSAFIVFTMQSGFGLIESGMYMQLQYWEPPTEKTGAATIKFLRL